MITEELVELTNWILDKKTERQDLEIKAANGGCPKRLYDTLSSFSNQDGGGIIFFGVDETQNFRLVGVYDLQDLKKGCGTMQSDGSTCSCGLYCCRSRWCQCMLGRNSRA